MKNDPDWDEEDERELPAIKKALAQQGRGWVCWVDADAMIMNRRLTLESLLRKGKDLIFASDGNGLCAGILLIRHCEWSFKFLDAIVFLGDLKNEPDELGPKWEQNTIKYVLNQFKEFANHVAILPERRMNSNLSSFQRGDFVLHLGATANGERERIFRQARQLIVT
jgi:hypothetical protein